MRERCVVGFLGADMVGPTCIRVKPVWIRMNNAHIISYFIFIFGFGSGPDADSNTGLYGFKHGTDSDRKRTKMTEQHNYTSHDPRG